MSLAAGRLMRLTLVMMWWFAACSGSGGAESDAAVAEDAAVIDDSSDASRLDAQPATCPVPNEVEIAEASELIVTGDSGSSMGIFDASIVYPAGATRGVMSYSSVPDQETIRTRIAVSEDGGASWAFVAQPNAPEPAVLPSTDPVECPGGACAGNLISEVSSIVEDPDDPAPARRWKLFAHRYLVGPGVALHYRIGTISLQTAPAPGGPWSAPAKLIGWPSPSPYSSEGVLLDVSDLPGLDDCLVLTEPGALWHDGALHLAVGCVHLDGAEPRIRIELLRSEDHAASWSAAGTLLRPEDATCLSPGASINAGELFADGDSVHVAATPSDATGYHGCLVAPIADLARAELARRGDGRPVLTRTIAAEPAVFAGACSFAAGGGGYVMNVGLLDQARRFRIMRTGLSEP
jgi:hypothetical protein